MEQVVLQASRREANGKGAARQARRDGFVPGVVYGMNQSPMSIALEREAFERALAHHHGGTLLVDLKVEGAEVGSNTAALLKQVQRHPVSRDPESVDFQWIALGENVTVMVPVATEGVSPAIRSGGVLDLIMHEVEVTCRPLAIPESIVISIEGMEMHEVRTAAQLQVPEGVELAVAADAPVVTVVPPSKEEEAREAPGVEGEITDVKEAG
jgi:large subunit ribosomal protein L25